MKSLQLLAAMSVLALSVSACSTTKGIPDLSGQKNSDTGKYMPTIPVTPPPAKTSSVGYPSSASASVQASESAQSGYSSSQNMAKPQQHG